MTKDIQRLREHISSVEREFTKQMLALATSAFGLVAALAWNSFIQEVVNQYIKPLIGGASGLVSLLIYAVVVTLLAVIVTYNLSRLVKD